jgi:O-Antigen ligase
MTLSEVFTQHRKILEIAPGLRDALPALAVTAALVGTGLEDGGFFSGSWATTAVGLLWLTAVALLLGVPVELSALEWAWVGALAAFVAWTALSVTWSVNSTESLLEVRRGVVYLAAVGAVLLLSTRRSPPYVLGAVIAAAGVVVIDGLARYLVAFERRPDEFQGNLLFRPLGYANAMGILAGLGIVLAIGLSVRAPAPGLRALAAASVAPFAAAVWLTSSRASALAVAVGLAAMLLLDRDRMQLVGAMTVLGPIAAVVVALSARARVAGSTAAGNHARLLALGIVLAAVVAALACPAAERMRRRIEHAPRAWRFAAGGLLVAAAVVGALLAHGRVERFFTTGYRPAYWHVAWREFTAHPWLGSGAGTFGDYWTRYGNLNLAGGALDAHNLYLETLAEVGPVGLVVLASALVLPLVAALRVRSHPLSSAAAGAYVAFLAHAALDWDWEMPTVTLAALACAAALTVAGREQAARRTFGSTGRAAARAAAVALTVALALFALVAQLAPGLGGTGP